MGIKGVTKHPRVGSAEDWYFVVGFVTELLGVVWCESFFVWEFFYFSLGKIKRFQNCGNLFGVLGSAPFFWIQTSAEHLVFCCCLKTGTCLGCHFNSVSPLFYRALLGLQTVFGILKIVLKHQLFFGSLFHFKMLRIFIQIGHFLGLKEVSNFSVLLPADIIRCRFWASVYIKRAGPGCIMHHMLWGKTVLGRQHFYFIWPN